LGTTLGKVSPNGKKAHDNRSKAPREALADRLNKKFIDNNPPLDILEKDQLTGALSCLIDYPRTGVEGKDDERVLYNAVARVVVITFNVFQGLTKYTVEEKEALYDGFIDKVLEKQGWINGKSNEDVTVSTHQVGERGSKQSITKEIVRIEVEKISLIDFASNQFEMRPIQKEKEEDFRTPIKHNATTKKPTPKPLSMEESSLEDESPLPSPTNVEKKQLMASGKKPPVKQ
jgi:hypothetical protein